MRRYFIYGQRGSLADRILRTDSLWKVLVTAFLCRLKHKYERVFCVDMRNRSEWNIL